MDLMSVQMLIQTSKPINPSLLSLLCLTSMTWLLISTGIQRHKLTDKLYITCLLMVQLLCKIYILWKNQKYLQNFVR